MTTSPAFTRLALALALLAGCGSKTETFTCEPACPLGWTCTTAGCQAPGGAGSDMVGSAGGDMAMAPCAGGCSGDTPYCNANSICVACLMDGQCPAGKQCKQIGLASACVTGCSNDQGCAALGASMKCCSGACTDTDADGANCGGCGVACAPAHAAAVCSGGACSPGACEGGYGDCNHDPSDGCEVHVALDPNNCGGCGTTCNIDHAEAGCSSGCYIAACVFGWADCDGEAQNGCEQSVVADAKNCGACGQSCGTAPHGMVGCINATCQLTSCSKGFLDCDGSALDGCEVTGDSDPSNCGACGNTCSKGMVCRGSQCTCPQCNIPNASSKCANNQCIIDKCNPGWGNCDGNDKNGCEADLTRDPNNCKSCNTACAVNTPYCVQSECINSNHNLMALTPDCNTMGGGGGGGDFSTWWTQNFGMMTYDDCESTANQYGAQFMGETGYFGNNYDNTCPYAHSVRWVGEADTKSGWTSTQNWSQAVAAGRGTMSNCVLAYANDSAPGMDTFDTTWMSDNGKTYQVNDYGVISERTCYSNARAAGARPLNPWMFADAMKTTAHMVENHINHGSLQYNGLNGFNLDGNANHSYRCLVGYTNE